MHIYTDIPPFHVFVPLRYFYNGDPCVYGDIECKVIALQSYRGFAPLFTVVSDEGALFSDLPIHALHCDENQSEEGSLHRQCHLNAPDDYFALHVFEPFVDLESACYDRERQFIAIMTYMFTVDWYRKNDVLHLMRCESQGLFYFLPSHKILFGVTKGKKLPDYKRQQSEWRV